MAIRHADVFPVGSSPDSISWEQWNADHIGGGDADFSTVAEDILPATDDTFDIGSLTKRWAEGYFSDLVSLGAGGVLKFDVTRGFYSEAGDEIAFRVADPAVDQVKLIGYLSDSWGDVATEYLRLDGGEGEALLRLGQGLAGAVINLLDVQLTANDGNFIIRDGQPGGGQERFLFRYEDVGAGTVWRLTSAENVVVLSFEQEATSARLELQQPAGTYFEVGVSDYANDNTRCYIGAEDVGVLDLRAFRLPATDPAVAGQVFTMDSAGVAAALAAGARYLLISDGP